MWIRLGEVEDFLTFRVSSMIVFCQIHSVVCRSEPANKSREIVEFVYKEFRPQCAGLKSTMEHVKRNFTWTNADC